MYDCQALEGWKCEIWLSRTGKMTLQVKEQGKINRKKVLPLQI